MRQITAPELHQLLNSTDSPPFILDVREKWEYDICHLEDSQLIPMSHIPIHVSDIPDDQDVVVVCHHGVRSMQVCYFLAAQGFDRLINLSGGIDAWSQLVDPTMAHY